MRQSNFGPCITLMYTQSNSAKYWVNKKFNYSNRFERGNGIQKQKAESLNRNSDDSSTAMLLQVMVMYTTAIEYYNVMLCGRGVCPI